MKSPRSEGSGGLGTHTSGVKSAGAARKNAEERLDVGVGANPAVAVEVGVGGAVGATVAREAGEERLDVRVGTDGAVAVVVVAAARGQAEAVGRADAEPVRV